MVSWYAGWDEQREEAGHGENIAIIGYAGLACTC